ncbi:MAG TPA: 6-phosphogluconolactonase [Mycobacterium sp.]|nr:6-phosphogluconolactonase [Mycobacterium sp.]
MSDVVIETYADTDELATAAGSRLVGAITSAIARRGVAHVVLTGGGTGIALLRHVARYGLDIDWSKVHLYWGDDRFVPHDDDERNARQAYEALLEGINIPHDNVHVMAPSDGEFGTDIAAAATAYERVLANTAPDGQPTPEFDVHLLGMGPEGHINSLFPDTAAVRETTRMVIGVTDSPKPPPQRITLTLPAIQRSREVWLVVGGAGKAEAVAAAVGGANPVDLPAAGAVGRERTVWLLDTAAASLLR